VEYDVESDADALRRMTARDEGTIVQVGSALEHVEEPHRGRDRVVVDHITRIDPACAPHWPQPDEGVGDHRVIIDGDPQLTIVSRADVPGGTRADGGNTTAANRLLGAIEWLATQKPGVYDGLDVPLHTALPDSVEATRWAD